MEATGPSTQERRNEQTRERIRAAAVRLFLDKGYEETSVGEIADAADISERTLFRYFRAKEDILFGRPEAQLPQARRFIMELKGEMSEWEVIQIALRTFASVMQSNEDQIRPAVELIHTLPDLHARRTLMQERWALAVAEALATRRGQEEATFDDLALSAAALALYGAAVRRWLSESDRDLPELVDEAFHRFEVALDAAVPPSSSMT